MKRLIFLFLLASGSILRLQAQNVFPLPSGNVGIGTTTPAVPLQVISSNNQQAQFATPNSNNTWISVTNSSGQVNLGVGLALPHPYLYSYTGDLFIGADGNNPTLFVNGMAGGNVGIGTITPAAALHVVSTGSQAALFKQANASNTWISVANNTGQMNMGVGAATPHPYIWSSTGSFFIGDDGNPTVFVSGMYGGSVGIGTLNTGTNKLAVEGTIAARKVIVTLSNPFPDYVFTPDYRLPSLETLSDYIHAHHHLPEIPSADSVARSGLDLESNQVALLKKIEELTLYVIAQNKRTQEQDRKLAALTKELHKLQRQAASTR
ncbi:MAG TPA: hypothetical protein VNS58_05930 [Puia sp.]|nr:hypothetical protein [Puia sp.]